MHCMFGRKTKKKLSPSRRSRRVPLAKTKRHPAKSNRAQVICNNFFGLKEKSVTEFRKGDRVESLVDDGRYSKGALGTVLKKLEEPKGESSQRSRLGDKP